MVAIILIAVAAIVWAPRVKSPPSLQKVTEKATNVRAMAVSRLDIVPSVVGYGRIRPARTWEAVAQVAGQVVWMADDLRDGMVIPKDTPLLRIEDADYRLILVQADAQLKVSRAKQKTAADGLSLAEKNQVLLEKEYERQSKLAKSGAVSQAGLEAAERQLLAGSIQVENQRNDLALLEAEEQVLIAQRDTARLNLQRTEIKAPMDVRIVRVDIGLHQYANKGQFLFEADGLDTVEVEARFSVGVLRPLIKGRSLINPSAEEQPDISTGVVGLQASVLLRTANHKVQWPARVDRVSGSINPLTQSVGVIVAIDRPQDMFRPGERPPLLRDTFVEVELSTGPIDSQIVIPSSALNNNAVYVIADDSRLEVRPVKTAFAIAPYTVIAKGLKPGEKIVTSELITAVEGMLLAPQEDKRGKQRLVKAATGKDPRP